MKNLLRKLWKDEEGQDLVEYALLVVLVSPWRYRRNDQSGERYQRRLFERRCTTDYNLITNPSARPGLVFKMQFSTTTYKTPKTTED